MILVVFQSIVAEDNVGDIQYDRGYCNDYAYVLRIYKYIIYKTYTE